MRSELARLIQRRKHAESRDLICRMQLFFTTHNLCFPMIHRARFMMSLHHGGIRTKPSLALVYAVRSDHPSAPQMALISSQ